MTQLRRRLLLLPLVLALAFATGQVRAQTPLTGRFAFADTTLLRDTLNLTFERLFPLADSLQVPPDSLRAWAIRYRFPLERLISLADSLAMPVDSVGPVMLRESYNPLASGERTINAFTYTSGYTIGQTSSSWVNGADVNIVRGPMFFRNNTSITLDEYGSSRRSYQQNRQAQNEAGWKVSPNLSIGGRANLGRIVNEVAGALRSERETKSEYQLSVRTRQQPVRGISSELNFFGGVLDVNNVSLQKNGLQHDLNGRIRMARGSWLTHDLQGQLTGNAAGSNPPDTTVRVDTRDRSSNLRGSLNLFNASPVSFSANYNLRDIRVQNPAPADSLARGIRVTEVITRERGADAALRLRRDNDRFVNVTQRFSNREQASSISASVQNERVESALAVAGRYGIRNVSLDGSFNLSQADARFPRRNAQGGYAEDVFSRSISGTMTWTATPRMVFKGTGTVSLSSSRYEVIERYVGLPSDRDSYRQSYRSEVLYNRSERFNTSVALEVERILSINLPAASTASNNEIRSYLSEWRWSYRLSRGLTATQRNQLSADYTYYRLSNNNRLQLDYSTITTLNAVLTPRLQLDVNHSARHQPSGNYVRFEDGLDYLREADETDIYTLDARMSYAPFPGVALNVRPLYQANDRFGTVEGVSVPQRRSRMLNVTGGASLDIPVGAKGQLTGDLSRSFRADQATSYTSGAPRSNPVNEEDFWVGSLQFRWSL